MDDAIMLTSSLKQHFPPIHNLIISDKLFRRNFFTIAQKKVSPHNMKNSIDDTVKYKLSSSYLANVALHVFDMQNLEKRTTRKYS